MFLSRLLPMALVFISFSHAVWAGQITLKSTTSSVELVGELKSFDNEVYIIETDLGELEIDARTVTCTGASCPEIKSLASKFAIAGDQALINQLLIPLLENYSFSLDATIETTIETDTRSNITIIAKDGQEFANVSVQPGTGAKLQNTLVIKSGASSILSKVATKATIVPIAVDAFVAITSDTNAVKSISLDALHGVLSGSITNWKDLGGPDADINVYLPEKTSDLAKIAKNMGFDLSKSPTAKRFHDLKNLSKVTANDPYGLGFTNYANRRTASALPILGSCGAYVRPNAFNIASGSYPATFYHYLEIDAEALPIFAREFLSYLGGSQAKSMIDRQGYPSLSVFEAGLENQGNRIVHGLLTTTKSVPTTTFRTMLSTLKTARQLSTVFHLNTQGTALNPQSTAALDALVSELFMGRFADQLIIIIGFTGTKGSTNGNKDKSKAAAVLVSNLIKAADSDGLLADLQIETLGFGEASPLACEDTPLGIAANNRVEVWVKDVF